MDSSAGLKPPRSPTNGGCDFATDPRLSALEVPIFWTPSANPATIFLGAAPDQPGNDPLNGEQLATISRDADGVYRQLHIGGADFSTVLLDMPEPGMAFAATLLLDEDTPDRIEALSRFWAALRHPPASPDPRLTLQRRYRLREMLRVVDARIEGTTYRAIAQILYPQHHIDAASWAGNTLRETTIRLARDGLKLIEGGYRTLLRRPRRS